MIIKIFIKHKEKYLINYNFLKKKFRRINTSIDNHLLSGYPLERDFGSKRGSPLDRYYIERFIEKNKLLIKGRVLEVGDDRYSKNYVKTSQINVLRGKDNREYQNLNGDLLDFETIKNIGTFDSLIITNVLNFIFDYDTAIQNIAKLTNKNGQCLFTVSGISGISKFDNDRWGDYWRFSTKSFHEILNKYFEKINIDYYGNASIAASLILGLVREDIPNSILNIKDEDFPVIITAIASLPKH